jgi:hypothetical protein
MKQHNMRNLRIDGFVVTVDLEDHGTVTLDFSKLGDFFSDFPHLKNEKDFAKGQLKHGALWFPPDIHIHIEPEYIIEQEEDQKALPIGASFKERIVKGEDMKLELKDIYIVVQRPHGKCEVMIFTDGSPEFFAMIHVLEASAYGFQVTTAVTRCLGASEL